MPPLDPPHVASPMPRLRAAIREAREAAITRTHGARARAISVLGQATGWRGLDPLMTVALRSMARRGWWRLRPRDVDRLAGWLIGGFLDGLDEFGASGFGALQADWERFDVLRGREVVVTTDTATVTGIALGIAPGGALRVRTVGEPQIREFLAADVSVRANERNP